MGGGAEGRVMGGGAEGKVALARWDWGAGGGVGGSVGLPQLALSFLTGLAGGGGSKRLGIQSASSPCAEPLQPLLLAPDTHPYLSAF